MIDIVAKAVSQKKLSINEYETDHWQTISENTIT